MIAVRQIATALVMVAADPIGARTYRRVCKLEWNTQTVRNLEKLLTVNGAEANECRSEG